MSFSGNQFTATKWATSEDKLAFAKQFVKFVRGGFSLNNFTDKFYRRLSNCFGHIAHHNRGGFWDEFFTTTSDKIQFLDQTLSWPCYGDPAWTYSDVERALQNWLVKEGTLERLRRQLAEEIETQERAELDRLKSKYD